MRAADRLLSATVRRGGVWPTVLVVAAVGGSALQLLLPYVLGRTVDELLAGSGHTWFTGSVVVISGVVVCESLSVWAAGASSADASAWLRGRLLHHVLGAGPGLTRRFPEGDVVNRLGMNAEEVGRAPEAVTTAAVLLIPTVGGVVALALIDPWLPLALMVGLLVIVWVLRAFLRDTTTIAGEYQETQGDIAGRLVEALSGIRTIAAAGTADAEARRVLARLPDLREQGMRLWRANARAGVQAGLTVPLLEVAVLGVAGLRMASGDLTIGELYAAARYVVLGAGLSSALGHLGRLARARSAAGRVAELLAEPISRSGDKALPAGLGTLEFRQVFSAPLLGIDLVVPGGTATAVVGRSGSGKSSLAALAGRLLDPESGDVLLDGVPLLELDRSSLRRAVGYAFERPILVGETLGDAVALGLPVPDREKVLASATAARADAFVRLLPDGYATPLADAPMSGGERQRLGLARAFAQGERLLILDDATSSLDTVTERQVTAALTGSMSDRTRLIVAHRASTAARCDRVIWLEDGQVRAYDEHRKLWRDPAYRAAFQEPS